MVQLLDSGDLSPEQRALLEQHMAQCEHCRNLYGWQLQLSKLLREELEEPPAGFAAAVMARGAQEPVPGTAPEAVPPRQTKRRAPMRLLAGLAAALLLVAVAPTALQVLNTGMGAKDQVLEEGEAATGLLDATPEAADMALFSLTGEPEDIADDIDIDEQADSTTAEPASVERNTGGAVQKAEADSGAVAAVQNNSMADSSADTRSEPGTQPDSEPNAEFATQPSPAMAATQDQPMLAQMELPVVPEGADSLAPEAEGLMPETASCSLGGGIGLDEDWTLIFPTALLSSPADVLELLIWDAPPEEYAEHIAADTVDYYVLAVEEGYLLVAVLRSEE